MLEYSSYTKQLEELVASAHLASTREWKQSCYEALNGGPIRELRETVDLVVRRKSGVFFTSNSLATELLRGNNIGSIKPVFFDPACGVGNLLIAAAREFPIYPSLKKTLIAWNQTLTGIDKYEVFARATRARLALLAISKGAIQEDGLVSDLEHLLPNIRQGDGLSYETLYNHADWIIINPPYSMVNSPSTCEWARGKVNAAALFIEAALRRSSPNSRMTAILPDVLRSGSRYARWRQMVEGLSSINKAVIVGIFDKDVDVDVFILDLIVTKKSSSRSITAWDQTDTFLEDRRVKDFFNVHVGPVVPHRDPNRGPSYPYIHARTATAWQTVNHLAEERQYSGTVFTPPFVVVRRTSSPRDKHRSVATIINEQRNVAVENHLLVLLPRDKSLQGCMKLLNALRTQYANDWFNERIRCRHLTVSAMRDFLCSTSPQNRE